MASNVPLDKPAFSGLVREIIKDRDRWAAMEFVAWEAEQIVRVMDNLKGHGNRGGSINAEKYENLKNMLQNRKTLLAEFNHTLTETENRMSIQKKPGSKIAKYPTAKFIKYIVKDKETNVPERDNEGNIITRIQSWRSYYLEKRRIISRELF